MSYQPYKGTLPDGSEVLVSLWCNNDKADDGHVINVAPKADYVEVAFRPTRGSTWGPPVTLERAP